MSHRNDSSRKHRKSRGGKKDEGQFQKVSFDGAQSVDIPMDEGKSPVKSRFSLLSESAGGPFYMDEIALLKRGKMDKDAPKHPYNRYGGIPDVARSPLPTRSPAMMTFLGVATENDKVFKLGDDGVLKTANIKGGGERFEVSSGQSFSIYQESNGQRYLFNAKN